MAEFSINICVNDGQYTRKTVKKTSKISDLHPQSMLMWHDKDVVFDISDMDSVVNINTTLEQLNLQPSSFVYLYTTEFPCPSGDLRSIIPKAHKNMYQFAMLASKMFEKTIKKSPHSEVLPNPNDRNDGSNLYKLTRTYFDSESNQEIVAREMFNAMTKNDGQEINLFNLHCYSLVEEMKKMPNITYEQFKPIFIEFAYEIIQKEEMMNDPKSELGKRFAEEKRQRMSVDEMYVQVHHHHPEDLIPVTMLYINLTINGKAVKAFIDSGAQKSIMSLACAERCNLTGLIDRRFAGAARGVGGSEKIEGRIHLCDVKVENAHFACQFEVMARREMDLLIGLNVLRKHNCNINLGRNRLEFPDGTSTQFLQSMDIDEHLKNIQADGGDDERMDTEPGPSK